MLIKILYLISLCLGAETTKSALKEPSSKYSGYKSVTLSPQIDLEALEIESDDFLCLFLQDLVNQDNYQRFMKECHPFEEISKEQSWELRYYILTSWAEEKRIECTDHHGFFPIISTESIENVYIPLALLLKQGFRKDTPSYPCLLDICLISLQEYLAIMVHDGNPYDPKQPTKQHHKIRYPYKKAVLETVAELEEYLSVKADTDDRKTKLRFNDEIKILEIDPNRSPNYFLRNLIDTGNAISRFCLDVLRTNPAFFGGYATTKECLYDLHAKYGILYDFVFNSEHSIQICLMGLNMTGIRPQFDQVWETYKDQIEEWSQQQICAMFYPKVFAEVSKVHLQSKSEYSQETFSGHKLVRTKSFSDLLAVIDEEEEDDEEDLSITGFDAAGQDFSKGGDSLEIPLLSKTGQLSSPK